MRLLSLLLAMLALAALPSSAAAGPDRVTGGVTVPDGRLTGGGADGGEPAVPEPAPTSAARTGAADAPAARAAQTTGEPAPEPAPQQPEEDEDVEVRVPVQEEQADRPAAPAREGGGLGGLAQTGFAAAALAAAGALCAGAGLALRRLTRC